jgi:hypothetical protein
VSSTVRLTTDQRSVHLLDGVVVFWCVFWCVLGVWTGVTLWQAADVGDTISASGSSLASVGRGLESLSDLPVIGERPGEIGAEVNRSAAEIVERGAEVKGQLRLLGVFLGIGLVGIPVTPVLGLYLPLRLRRAREIRAIRGQLEQHRDDPGFDRWLADRARATLPYSEVAGHGSDERGLADAELTRLGISRSEG